MTSFTKDEVLALTVYGEKYDDDVSDRFINYLPKHNTYTSTVEKELTKEEFDQLFALITANSILPERIEVYSSRIAYTDRIDRNRLVKMFFADRKIIKIYS